MMCLPVLRFEQEIQIFQYDWNTSANPAQGYRPSKVMTNGTLHPSPLAGISRGRSAPFSWAMAV
jgi:hypothetical protein